MLLSAAFRHFVPLRSKYPLRTLPSHILNLASYFILFISYSFIDAVYSFYYMESNDRMIANNELGCGSKWS
jgi:hypothetical protein